VRTKGVHGETPVWTDSGHLSILPANHGTGWRNGVNDLIGHTGSDLRAAAFSGGKVHDF
jgi:hypothetical protein